MADNAWVVSRFKKQIDGAMRKARRYYGSWVGQDERTFCVERLLVYAGPDVSGDRDSGLLRKNRSLSKTKLDALIYRALWCDLMDELSRKSREERRYNYGGFAGQISSGGKRFANTAEEPSAHRSPVGEHTDYVDSQFPMLVLHYANGLSLSVIAQMESVTKAAIMKRIGKERRAFIQWAEGQGFASLSRETPKVLPEPCLDYGIREAGAGRNGEPRWFADCPRCRYLSPDVSSRETAEELFLSHRCAEYSVHKGDGSMTEPEDLELRTA